MQFTIPVKITTLGTVLVFEHEFALEDATGFQTCLQCPFSSGRKSAWLVLDDATGFRILKRQHACVPIINSITPLLQ
jgi:hypothetical protein